ncbi:hypothetical protein EI94DRAFT_1717982 [Lactarius quietus]|nr:hypothetical protein EI94DRAFT_1717982 [Lactarius quietus]
MTAPFLSTRTAHGCPSIRCFPCLSPRTSSTATRQRRRHYPSTGQKSTLSQTATACASSCVGLTRRREERCATLGSMSNSWGRRPSCWAAGKAASVSHPPAARTDSALRTRHRAPRRAVLPRAIIGRSPMYAIRFFFGWSWPNVPPVFFLDRICST